MNRFLSAFNFLGVITLATLCTMQWHVNSVVNGRANLLEVTRQQQESKLEGNDRTIKSYSADLADFHSRLSLAETQLKQLDNKLAHETAERNQIALQRDNLTAALAKWMAAVADRDKILNQAKIQLQAWAKDRNDGVQRLNDLTDKYNALVKQWNDQQSRH